MNPFSASAEIYKNLNTKSLRNAVGICVRVQKPLRMGFSSAQAEVTSPSPVNPHSRGRRNPPRQQRRNSAGWAYSKDVLANCLLGGRARRCPAEDRQCSQWSAVVRVLPSRASVDMVGGPGGRDTAPSSRRGHLGSSRSTERNAQLLLLLLLSHFSRVRLCEAP